jgi:hypothetical protein
MSFTLRSSQRYRSDVADPTSPPEVWQWLDSVWGFGAGIVSAVVGMALWILPRIRRVENAVKDVKDVAHEENDHLAIEFHGRVTSIEKLLIALQENNLEHMRLYSSVKDELKALASVTNEQTKILYQMRGAMKIKGGIDE